jgi:divalent metal cation (Fe/Co/Zn/Cd) transporter
VSAAEPVLAPSDRTRRSLLRRGLRLEYTTLAWNVVGSVLVLGAAVVARSVALVGFGLDSLIEILASLVVIWQLNTSGVARERKALRLIGIAFLLLAIYIAAQSAYVLTATAKPHTSPVGIAWLAVTALTMFALAYGKSVTGNALANRVLATEARVTMIDGLLAISILIGLLLNAALGWWWADPLAALAIVYYGAREGRAALKQGRGRHQPQARRRAGERVNASASLEHESDC